MSDKTYEELLDELESYNTRVSTATDTYEESLGTIASAVTTSRLASESATESETNAATSETNASTSETNAATSESNASASATAAALSETNASTYNSSASAYANAASQSASDAAASLASLDDQVTLASGYADNAEASATAAAESLATFVSMPEPDVFITFNDGVELRAGYGTRNTYGNKAVDFSRASTTGNINKSGVLETVAIDEAAITSDGLSVYGSYTNELLYSEDFSQTAWTRQRGVVSTTYEKDSTGVSFLSSYTYDGTSVGGVYLVQTIAVPTGDSVVVSAEVKYLTEQFMVCRTSWSDGSSGVGLSTIDLLSTSSVESGDVSMISIDGLPNNAMRFNLLVNNTAGDSSTVEIRFYVGSDIFTQPDIGGGIYISNVSATNTTFCTPYIATESTAVTRSADTATIPQKNNLPATGEPFSDVFDIVWNGVESFIGETETRGYGIYITDTGDVIVRGETTEATIATGLVSGEKYRIGLTYDGTNVTGYLDGVVGTTSSDPDITYSVDESFYIGRSYDGTVYLNSEIANYKRWFKELSAAQFEAMGAAA